MKKTGKNIIAFQNIDHIKYPDTYGISRIKLNRPFQEIIMANIHAVDEKEMQEGTEEIFLDFRKIQTGKLEIKVKDRRKEHPAIASKFKDIDVSKGNLNVLNLFVDTVSRGRFFRVFPRTIEFLVNMKNK